MAGSMQGCRMSSEWEASPPALHGVQAPLYMQLQEHCNRKPIKQLIKNVSQLVSKYRQPCVEQIPSEMGAERAPAGICLKGKCARFR